MSFQETMIRSCRDFCSLLKLIQISSLKHNLAVPVLKKLICNDLDLEDDLSGSLFLLFRQNLTYVFFVFVMFSIMVACIADNDLGKSCKGDSLKRCCLVPAKVMHPSGVLLLCSFVSWSPILKWMWSVYLNTRYFNVVLLKKQLYIMCMLFTNG